MNMFNFDEPKDGQNNQKNWFFGFFEKVIEAIDSSSSIIIIILITVIIAMVLKFILVVIDKKIDHDQRKYVYERDYLKIKCESEEKIAKARADAEMRYYNNADNYNDYY